MLLPPTALRRRVRIRLRGIVQGVGFRPFVHNLASELNLGGYVLNSSAGLVAEVEGEPASLDRFIRTVTEQPPPLAWVQESECSELDVLGERSFAIRPSAAVTGEFALISPDVATCADCRSDVADPTNRRFAYPFTNCTHCGPRYTIIRDIPYDRPKTTMAPFTMCAACQAEYEDPRNRRFHAQPNACPACGPTLLGSGAIRWQRFRHLLEARRRLAAGEILAIKGLGGFHFACDARNPSAVARLRARKRRSDKPFALMARDLAAVGIDLRGLGSRSEPRSPVRGGPIVILPPQGRSGIAGSRRPPAIVPSASCSPTRRCTTLLLQRCAYPAARDDQRQPQRGAHRRVEHPKPGNGSPAWPIGSSSTTAISSCASTIPWSAPSKGPSASCAARVAMCR